MKKVLLAVALAFAFTSAASADVTMDTDKSCKNAKITITNNYGKDIKAYGVEYKDFEDKGKVRYENVNDEKMGNGDKVDRTEDLGSVGDEETQLRLKFKYYVGSSINETYTYGPWTSKKKCSAGGGTTFSVNAK